jgi:type IV fimbrial biogenesis protein FimT
MLGVLAGLNVLSTLPSGSGSRRPCAAQAGFTLVEVMIAVAILAVIMAMAMPVFGDWLLNAQIRTASESLESGLQQARNEAVRRNTAVEFHLTDSASGWEIRLAGGATLATRLSAEGTSKVVLTTFPAAATILTFDGMGRRYPSSQKNLGGTDILTTICVDLSSSALPAAKTHDLELDIGIGGSVRMCDPKVSSSTDTRACAGYPTACTAL